jgi:hypothetical protein
LQLATDVELNFTKYNHILKLNKNDKIKLWTHKKDTFSSITKVATDINMNIEFIVKHPAANHIMYMLGKK